MNITISIMSLRTNNWKYYNVTDFESYNNAITEFNNEINWFDGDYEVQLIDHNVPGLTDDNLYDVLEIIEEVDADPELIASIYSYYSNKADTMTVLEDNFYYIVQADNEVDAIQEYVEENDLLQIPDHLQSYIDWNSVYRDYKCSGYTRLEMNNNKWCIITPW